MAPCIERNENVIMKRQLKRSVLTMLSFAGSIGLYYLGFFGTTDGPLNPEKLGALMANNHVTPTHLLVGLIVLFMISISWNWVYNLINKIRTYFDRCSQDIPYQPVRKGRWAHTLWAAVLIVLVGVAGYMI